MDTLNFHKSAVVGTLALTDIDTDVVLDTADMAEIVLEPQYFPNDIPHRGGRLGGFQNVVFEVRNEAAGDAGLGNFAILGKPHKNAGWHNLLSSLGEEGAYPLLVVNLVGNPTTSGGAAFFNINCGPLYAVKFQAQSAGEDVLTNGALTDDADDWTLGDDIAYGTNNVAFTAASATMKQLLAAMATAWTAGVRYELTFTLSGVSGGGSLWAGTNTEPQPEGNEITADGTHTLYVEADDHADGLVLTADGFTGVIDTISLKPCAEVQVMGRFYR